MAACPYVTLAPETNNSDENEQEIYSIEPEPVNPIVRQYVRGEADKRFAFSLLSWESRLTEEKRVANYQIYGQLAEWFEEITRSGLFPPMGGKREPIRIAVTGNGYMHDTSNDNDTCQYLMQIEFVYHERSL
jgi:hypothetical protein